jgi:hypothetical protein
LSYETTVAAGVWAAGSSATARSGCRGRSPAPEEQRRQMPLADVRRHSAGDGLFVSLEQAGAAFTHRRRDLCSRRGSAAGPCGRRRGRPGRDRALRRAVQGPPGGTVRRHSAAPRCARPSARDRTAAAASHRGPFGGTVGSPVR